MINKVGIELEVRLNKADAEIKKLRTELDKTRLSAQKADQQMKGFDKQLGAVKSSFAGTAGFIALVVGAGHAVDRLAERTIKLTGETDGLAGAWKQLTKEWVAAGDKLLVAIDRLPKALDTIEKEVGGTNAEVDKQSTSVKVLDAVWDGYLKRLSPMSGEDWFAVRAINSLSDAVDNLTLKTAKAGFGDALMGAAKGAAAENTLRTQQRMNREMQFTVDMLEMNALANDKVTSALDRRTKATVRAAKADPFAAQRSSFNDQLLSSQMAAGGVQMKTGIDRDKFAAEKAEADMAKAGMDAKRAQDAFEEEMHEKSKRRLEEHNRLLQAELDAKIEAERQKKEAIEATARAQMQVADLTASLTSSSVQLASMGAEAFVKGEKRKNAVMKGLAASEMVVVGITETVKAVAAFASFNYVEGALHTAAAAVAYANAAKLGSEAGGAGGGRGVSVPGAFGASAFGGGTDTGGSTQSSSGGGSRPSNNGPVSESEESVQRSGRGGRPGPTRGRQSEEGRPIVQVFAVGNIDDAGAIKIEQALKRAQRKSGRSTS